MKATDFERFSEVMRATSEMYGKSLSPAAITLYWQALQDLAMQELQAGLSAHINSPDNGQFMPRPADIRRMLGGTTTDAAMLAWSQVVKAARSVGAYQTVAFDDPLIHACISDMGGWMAICHCDVDDLPFRERDFVARYRAYRSRPLAQLSYPPKLLGIIDQTNLPNGYEAVEVAMIGDPDIARTVLAKAGGKPWLQVSYAPDAANSSSTPESKLGLLPRMIKAGEMSEADRIAMAAAERNIAARQTTEVAP